MKTIGIEDLLRWAYRDELPKQGSSLAAGGRPLAYGQGWDGVERFGDLMALVDEPGNAWGLVIDHTAKIGPHPDAVLVGQAVEALDALPLDLPEDWNPLADLGDLGALGADAVARAIDKATFLDAAGRRGFRSTPRALVAKHAVLGGAPDWQADQPEVKVVRGPKGKPRWFRMAMVASRVGPIEMEVDGFDPKLRVPYPDAYQKEELDPDPVDVAVARAEYEVWHAALGVLVEDLTGKLAAHEVVPTTRPARPWEGGTVRVIRVLPDLRVGYAQPAAPVRPQRRAQARLTPTEI